MSYLDLGFLAPVRPFVADKGILMDNEVSLVRGSESGGAGGRGRSQGQ